LSAAEFCSPAPHEAISMALGIWDSYIKVGLELISGMI
jgi:hypothetical protein